MTTLPRIPRWKTMLQSITMGSIPLAGLNQFLKRKGSTFQMYVGGVQPMIVTADPDFIQHILQKKHRVYPKLNRHFSHIKQFLGNGLLASNGAYWLKQRRLIQPGFHIYRLMEVMKLMDKVAECYLLELDQELEQNPEVNVFDKMKTLTFRIISNAIFSSTLKDDEFKVVQDILPRLQGFIVRMIRQPYMHWWLKKSGQIDKHENLKKKGGAVIKSYIQKRRASGESHDDLLQMLLDARYEETNKGMTDQQLIDEINILFMAGHDTSTNALSWMWYLLSKHPEVAKKLQEEIDRVIPGAEITFQQLKQLEYTQQVLEETLRLYPPVWATNRIAMEDDEFKGIKIKKGTTIGTYFYGLHRCPKIWENPEAFNPDRFSKAKKDARHSYSFLPFGGGPRLCIGKHFAMIEMKLLVAKMVKRYKMTFVEEQSIEAVPLVNLYPKNGIKMRIEKR